MSLSSVDLPMPFLPVTATTPAVQVQRGWRRRRSRATRIPSSTSRRAPSWEGLDTFHAEDVAPARLLDLEADEGTHEARALAATDLHLLLELVDLLHARLRLARLRRVGAEALHERLELLDLLLGGRVLLLGALPVLVLLLDEVLVVARVDGDRLVVDVRHVGDHLVEEVAVVGDDDERPAVLDEERLEPPDRLEVEVVRGLVEQEHVGLAEEHLRDEHAELVAGGQGVHPVLVLLDGDAEAFEELGRLGLGHVAVFFGDDALELAEPEAHLVGDLAREEHVLLLHRVPEGLVAHHDGVEDGVLVVGEVILTEHAEAHPAGDRDGADVRVLGPGEHLDERRLAGAVRAGEAVALARVELHRDVLERIFGRTAGDVVEDDHGAPDSMDRGAAGTVATAGAVARGGTPRRREAAARPLRYCLAPARN